mmetsp:Transcript_91677/g.259653  ORF Transcript_91677/g.259653 Transcript_91677/m.259653 type:complete len:292 (-) Transcript_91677:23-898(-)
MSACARPATSARLQAALMLSRWPLRLTSSSSAATCIFLASDRSPPAWALASLTSESATPASSACLQASSMRVRHRRTSRVRRASTSERVRPAVCADLQAISMHSALPFSRASTSSLDACSRRNSALALSVMIGRGLGVARGVLMGCLFRAKVSAKAHLPSAQRGVHSSPVHCAWCWNSTAWASSCVSRVAATHAAASMASSKLMMLSDLLDLKSLTGAWCRHTPTCAPSASEGTMAASACMHTSSMQAVQRAVLAFDRPRMPGGAVPRCGLGRGTWQIVQHGGPWTMAPPH